MGDRIQRTIFSVVIVLVFGTHAFEDPYSNSFISPSSAGDAGGPPPRILPTRPEAASPPPRTRRAADPAATDDSYRILYKNVEEALESNDVELSGRSGGFVLPSKTVPSPPAPTSTPELSGEGEGAPQPQARSLREPPRAGETAPAASATTKRDGFATRSAPPPDRPRQANPDIQDIITGLVKLLNGNVNVQANTAPAMGRPLRPLSTRINNRGPPRITDMPALPPDFDVPAPLPPPALGPMPPPLATTRPPAPYPFDVPPVHPNNVSPAGSRPYRPQGGGTGPPWKRRRPAPYQPPLYKPMPPPEAVSLTSERPEGGDVLTLDWGGHLGGLEGGAEEEEEQEITEFEKNKEKTSKLDKYTSKTTIVTPTLNTEFDRDTPTTNPPQPSSPDPTASQPPPSDTTSAVSTDASIAPTRVSDTTPHATAPVGTSAVTSHATGVATDSTGVASHATGVATDSTGVAPHATGVATDSTGVAPHATGVPLVESSLGEVMESTKESLAMTETEKLPMTASGLTTGAVVVGSSSGEIESSVTLTPDLTATIAPAVSSEEGGFPYHPYRPRPGIVLDDPEYKPGGGGGQRRPIVTRPPLGQIGDIFDITVSAVQGPGGGGAASAAHGKPYVIPVDLDLPDLVITSSAGSDGFVSIDGKRTYLNLFGDDAPTSVAAVATATAAPNRVSGAAYAVVEDAKVGEKGRRPAYGRPPRPSQPPVRIDTCIVGDDSTCASSQLEVCRTEAGVSACHCRPGAGRREHRDPCRRVVAVRLSLRVDRLYDRKVAWAAELADGHSAGYRQLAFEAEKALESAMSMTPFSDDFLSAKVSGVYRGDRTRGVGGVFVNATLQLEENADTSRPSVRADIQRHLLGVIQRRGNNVGESAVWVDGAQGAVSNLQDVDECSSSELHDCHADAACVNVFGGFRCECRDGLRDPYFDDKHRRGRRCERCPPQKCNNRGECSYRAGQEVCTCTGNYYGNQCELDGEVLGVAIGASVAAVIIIGLTLVCLVMWSRRWSREQKAAVGSPVFGYMATASNTVKTPVVGGPPYQLTLEDRLRWAQIADVMAQANHYAPEPALPAPTRPSSAMFGYPGGGQLATLHRHHGTLPPVPLPRLNLHAQMGGRAATVGGGGRPPFDHSSSSDDEDKADLLGRSFHVPRPKSRSNASVANQSGIYYDVDYEPNDIYKQSGGIPLSTYSIGRPTYFRN